MMKQHWFVRRGQRVLSYRYVISLLLAFGLSGCASMSLTDLFLGYSDQMIPMRQAWLRGDAQKAAAVIDKGDAQDTSYYLKQLEVGRLAFLAGQWEESRQTFSGVDSYIQQLESKAQYRLSSGLQQLGTAVTNDAAMSYVIPVYEQVMMHHYQALNYLKTNGLESALVEVRKANLLQEQALEKYGLNDEKSDKQYQASLNSAQARYPSLDEWKGSSKNAYQNAYTFILSAILYEADDALSDAYIDYKKAFDIQPQNLYLKQQVERLGQRLGMLEPVSESDHAFETHRVQGQVVVLYEQGMVPHRQEFAMSIPIASHGAAHYYSLALPVLQQSYQMAPAGHFNLGDMQLTVQPVAQLQGLAAWHLQKQLPGMMLRQIIRIATKTALVSELADDDLMLGLFAELLNMASERADTRSWESLPANAYFGASVMSTGDYQLDSPRLQQPLSIQVKPGKITLVIISELGPTSAAYVYQF